MQQGDREFLEAACRFLPACTEGHVRLAPEKCEGRCWLGMGVGGRVSEVVKRVLREEASDPLLTAWHGMQAADLQGCTLPPSHPHPTAKHAAVTALCRAVKAHAVALNQPKRGVLPLRVAVAKLCPTTDHLSPVHADLFQL